MGGEGRASVHDTTYDPLVEQNRCQVGPTILYECPAQIPRSSLRSFSLWARHSAETSAELNVRLGAAEFLPVASRQVRRVRKRRRKEMRGRRSERLGSRVGTRYKPAIRRLRRTAVRWGPQFSSSAPPRSPAPSFDHFPFGPASLRRPVPS